jgi:hypothetical protein
MDCAKLDAAIAKLNIANVRMDTMMRADAEFNEADHPRDESGKFGSSAEMASAVKAPDHTDTRGNNVSYVKFVPHAEAHKELTKAGFKRSTNKNQMKSDKMGRSAASVSSKVQESSYDHPGGHSARVKTQTPKYGDQGPTTYYNLTHTKPDNI